MTGGGAHKSVQQLIMFTLVAPELGRQTLRGTIQASDQLALLLTDCICKGLYTEDHDK